jgi:hypothetical protein
MTQQIDMSGAVDALQGIGTVWYADDLKPFVQGAIKAALEELTERIRRTLKPGLNFFIPRFTDLAPETLAWFIAEGERFLVWAKNHCGVDYNNEADGRWYWEARQRGGLAPDAPNFPPTTLTVRDDGLIYVGEASQ